jgi:serine/threonine protein phosphatase PrpC
MKLTRLRHDRSLGDTVAHAAGVSSEPDFTEKILDPVEDRFLIVATDGLWEFITSAETIDLVTSASSPADAVEALVKESNRRWMREEQVIDDTTIITAYLFGY